MAKIPDEVAVVTHEYSGPNEGVVAGTPGISVGIAGTNECEGCIYVFTSPVSGSRVFLGIGATVDGVATSGFVTFAPTGSPIPNPIMPQVLHYPKGVYATRDVNVARALMKPINERRLVNYTAVTDMVTVEGMLVSSGNAGSAQFAFLDTSAGFQAGGHGNSSITMAPPSSSGGCGC